MLMIRPYELIVQADHNKLNIVSLSEGLRAGANSHSSDTAFFDDIFNDAAQNHAIAALLHLSDHDVEIHTVRERHESRIEIETSAADLLDGLHEYMVEIFRAELERALQSTQSMSPVARAPIINRDVAAQELAQFIVWELMPKLLWKAPQIQSTMQAMKEPVRLATVSLVADLSTRLALKPILQKHGIHPTIGVAERAAFTMRHLFVERMRVAG